MKTGLDGDYTTRGRNFDRTAALMLHQLNDPQSNAIERIVAKSWLISQGMLSELRPVPSSHRLFDEDRYRAIPRHPLFDGKGGAA